MLLWITLGTWCSSSAGGSCYSARKQASLSGGRCKQRANLLQTDLTPYFLN